MDDYYDSDYTDSDDDDYEYDSERYLEVERFGVYTLVPVDTLDILVSFFEHKSVMHGNNTKH